MNRGFPSPLETDYSAVGGGTPLFDFKINKMYNLVKKEVWFSHLKALLLWESHASFYLSKMNVKKPSQSLRQLSAIYK